MPHLITLMISLLIAALLMVRCDPTSKYEEKVTHACERDGLKPGSKEFEQCQMQYGLKSGLAKQQALEQLNQTKAIMDEYNNSKKQGLELLQQGK